MINLRIKLIAVAMVGFFTSAAASYVLVGHPVDRLGAPQKLLVEICHPIVVNADTSVLDFLKPLGIPGHFGDQKSRLHLVAEIKNDQIECSIDDSIDPLTEFDRDRWVEIVRSDLSGFLNGNGNEYPVDDLGWDVFEVQGAKVNGRQRLLKIIRIGAVHEDFTTTVTLSDAPAVRS